MSLFAPPSLGAVAISALLALCRLSITHLFGEVEKLGGCFALHAPVLYSVRVFVFCILIPKKSGVEEVAPSTPTQVNAHLKGDGTFSRRRAFLD